MVATTFSGKGIFPETHPNWFWCGISQGIPNDLKQIIKTTDLLIIVGSKMGELSTGHYRTLPHDNCYYIDIDINNFNSNRFEPIFHSNKQRT